MMLRLEEQWAEVLSVFFLILGFVLSILLNNVFFSYLSIILAGFTAGRVFYVRRFREPIFPFILIIVGFLLGYLLGSFFANRVILLVLFAGSFVGTYQLYMKKILVIFKSEDFLK